MSFRPATIDDAELLFVWRMKDEQAVAYARPSNFDEHLDWLRDRLNNRLVHVLIWEQHGKPVGTVRIDSNGELAFHSELDDPVPMINAVHDYARLYGGRLKATTDRSDPKFLSLLGSGFVEYPAKSLVLKP